MSENKPRSGLFLQDSRSRVPPVADMIAVLEEKLGYRFRDRSLLCQALTHSTYAYEHRSDQLPDNERLEFLGDAVLDLAVSDILFRSEPPLAEGVMTKSRALVVCEETLATLARSIGLGGHIAFGRGEITTGGVHKPSNLSNAMEAIFGAIFLDSGYPACRQIIARLLDEPLRLALAGELVYDYKSRILEWVQSTRGISTLRFQILDEFGPVHERTFRAGVFLDDRLIATGSGNSKKEAEQQAAGVAMGVLNGSLEDCGITESGQEADPVSPDG